MPYQLSSHSIRLKPAERREIYMASLQSHVMRLVTVALSTPSFICNAPRIDQLAHIDHKETREQVLELGREVQKLLDRLKVLRATVSFVALSSRKPS